MSNQSREWQSLGPTERELISSYHNDFPVKLGGIAKDLGLIVKVRSLEAGISGKILDNGNSFEIYVNKHEIKERQRFTLAHEIAHYLLHRDLIGDGIVDSILYRSNLSDSREAEANRLAADILMPKFKVHEIYSKSEDLNEVQKYEYIAKVLGVSTTALKIRMGKA